VGGHEAFEVDDREVRRGGVSYTVETLRELSAQRPADELFLLLGADMLADLPNWREPAEVCRLATPVAVGRSGGPPIDFSRLDPLVTPQRRDQIARSAVEMPLVDLSSTQLRRRVADGQSIRYRTPPAVEQYIAAHGLYRAAPADQTE
jgi:nicotinate-nucleotide adenylyltransferase